MLFHTRSHVVVLVSSLFAGFLHVVSGGSASSLSLRSSERSSNLDRAMQLVTKLSSQPGGHDTDLSDTEKEALNTVRSFISHLQAEMVSEHTVDQRLLQDALARLEDCNYDVNEWYSNHGESRWNATVEARENHTSCRVAEQNASGLKNQSCSSWDNYRKHKIDAIPTCTSIWLTEDHIQTDNETNKGRMESCLTQTWGWIDPLYEAYSNCSDFKGKHDAQRKECNANQNKFEQWVCWFAEVSNTVCDDHARCFSREETEYRNTEAMVQIAEVARKSDYEASEVILCMFDVLVSNNTHKPEQLGECRNQTLNISQFNISYPAPLPGPGPCPNVTSAAKPCAPTFLEVEYTHQTWFEFSPTATCTPCLDHDYTTTTTTTTPAPVHMNQIAASSSIEYRNQHPCRYNLRIPTLPRQGESFTWEICTRLTRNHFMTNGPAFTAMLGGWGGDWDRWNPPVQFHVHFDCPTDPLDQYYEYCKYAWVAASIRGTHNTHSASAYIKKNNDDVPTHNAWDGKYHHFAMTFDREASMLKVYMDHDLIASKHSDPVANWASDHYCGGANVVGQQRQIQMGFGAKQPSQFETCQQDD